MILKPGVGAFHAIWPQLPGPNVVVCMQYAVWVQEDIQVD